MACGVAFIQFFFWCETFFFQHDKRLVTTKKPYASHNLMCGTRHTTSTQCTVKWMEKVSYRVSTVHTRACVCVVWSVYPNLTHSSNEQSLFRCQSCVALQSTLFVPFNTQICRCRRLHRHWWWCYRFDRRISTVSNKNPVCRHTKNSIRSQLIFYSNSPNCIEYRTLQQVTI